MLMSKTVMTTWNNSMIKYYEGKGYKYTKQHDEFEVRVEDLKSSSNIPVKVYCDYCLEKGIETIIEKPFSKYYKIHNKQAIAKDCCVDCAGEKAIQLGYLRRMKYTVIEKEFIKYKLNLLMSKEQYETDYKNNETRIPYICNKHKDDGIQYVTMGNLQAGKVCYSCRNENISETQKFDQDYVFDIFKQNNLIPIEGEKYINSHTPIKCICTCHNKAQQKTYDDVIKGACCKYKGIEQRSGDNSYNWKGGISDISKVTRTYLKEWKKDSLFATNFKCSITGTNCKLHIHHLNVSFLKIQTEVLNTLNLQGKNIIDFTLEERNNISEKCVELHSKYGIGLPMFPELHILFHSIYSNKDNTVDQFKEFINRLCDGEFNELLIKNKLKLLPKEIILQNISKVINTGIDNNLILIPTLEEVS